LHCGGYTYAVEFDGGFVKVGCTASPRNRLLTLRREFRREIKRYALQPVASGVGMYSAEAHALRTCVRLASKPIGGEMFAGLPFSEAVMAIRHGERRAHSIRMSRSGGLRGEGRARRGVTPSSHSES
jgi:hypothetical protein